MVANSCNHPLSTWRELLDNRLDRHQSDLLTEHIEICPACRSKFESVCAPPELWTESSQALRDIHDHEKTNAKIEQVDEVRNSTSMPESIDGYVLREVLGYGGMGTVYKAWDPRLYRLVALKVLHPHLAANGTARSRFEREAQSVACISHPHVVPIHDVAADHQPPYLVMAFISGGSLQERIEEHGPLPLVDALRIAVQIAEGLEAAHAQGLIHRDIKPANVLLEARGQRVLISDFGLARALDDAGVTASGFLAGTPQYMSPEQALGQKLDHRSDLFSLGSVLYTMLTGVPPFQGDTAIATLREVAEARPKSAHQHEPRLPQWIQPLLDKFHAPAPDRRIASANEAVSLLRLCLQYVLSPTTASLPSELNTVSNRSRVSPSTMGIIAILFLISLAGGYFAPYWIQKSGWKQASGIDVAIPPGPLATTQKPIDASANSNVIARESSAILLSEDMLAEYLKAEESKLPRDSIGDAPTNTELSEETTIDLELDRLDREIELLIDWMEQTRL